MSCHNHTLPAQAAAMARERGLRQDEAAAHQYVKAILAIMKPAADVLAQATDTIPDTPVSAGYILEALHANGYEPDRLTAAVVHNVAQKQMIDGRWIGWSPRGPIEGGDIQATAYAVRVMRLYGPAGRRPEFQARIEKARDYLRQARPATTEDRIMKLQGLRWSQAGRTEIAEAATALEAEQRADGGWAQLETLASDAYATGKALVALRQAAGYPASHPAVRRGVEYLRRTQREDGTWHVTTRAFPFQPLIDTGFPHGRDQWISAAATSWAAMALMLGDEPAPQITVAAQ